MVETDMKSFRRTKILIGSIISTMVAVALTTGNIYLAIVGILIGTLFMALVKYRSKEVLVDERADEISGRAARITYTIVTVFLGLISLFMIYAGRLTSEVYLESLGTVFCYTVCLIVAIYSMSYKYLDRKYSGDNQE